LAAIDPGEPSKEMRQAFDARIKFAATFRIEHHRIPTDEELDIAAPVQVVKLRCRDGDVIQRRLNRWKTENDGVIGIHYNQERGRWIASISKGRGTDVVARCLTAVEAAKQYNIAAKRIRGKFAVLCDLEAAKQLDERMAAI
jgi:hypothetical protein